MENMGNGISWIMAALLGAAVVSCPVVHTGAAGVDGASAIPVAELEERAYDEPDGSDNGGAEAGPDELADEEREGRPVPLESGPLESFFAELAALEGDENGIVRIAQWGDSHTAADFLTTAIRRPLQDRFGDAGRGFVLLGKPWRSYRPKDVHTGASGRWRAERILVGADPTTLDGRYGLGGVSVESDQAGASASVSTTRATGYGRKASTFEVFYLAQPGGGSFGIYADGRRRVTVSTAARSHETGFVALDANEGHHEFEVRLNGDGPVRLFGGVLENDGPGIVYDTLGVNGGFFRTPLRWDADLLAEQVEQRDPDLLITAYGTNETDSRNLSPEKYGRHVRETLARLREGAPDAACLLIGPPDRKVRGNGENEPSQLDWIIDVQREVAGEIGCGFLDARAMMGGAGAHGRWASFNPPLAQGDGIHLTVRGYRELGSRIARELIEAYESYLDQLDGQTAEIEDEDDPE